MENNKICCTFAPHFGETALVRFRFGGAKIQKMWQTIIISVGIVLISFVFLAITMLIKKEGRFPQTHVSQNRAMRERGIHCVQTQDWQERHRKGLYDDAQRPEHKK